MKRHLGKRGILLTVVIFATILLLGCKEHEITVPNPVCLKIISGNETVVEQEDGTFDLYNEDNKLVMNSEYDYFNDLSDLELYVVGYKGVYGVLNHSCKYVIAPTYSDIEVFTNMLYENETYQDSTDSFVDVIFFSQDDDGWHALDRDGDPVIELVFDDWNQGLRDSLQNIMFNIGLDNIDTITTPILSNAIEVQLGDKWGLLDFSGNIVLPIMYDGFDMFNGPSNYVMVEQDGLWGVVDHNNHIIMDITYQEIVTGNHTMQNEDGLWGIYEKNTGAIIIEPTYESISQINEITYQCLLDGVYTTVVIED